MPSDTARKYSPATRIRAAVAATLLPLPSPLACLPSAAPQRPAPKTFQFAFQGGLNSLDPYTLNEILHAGHAWPTSWKGLIKRDENLKIIPGLAERWEMLEPTRWRFHLRSGVKFHDGSPFTADDVVFSAERARSPGSQLKTRIPADAKVVKVDDYTVDFVLTSPNPILHSEWETWFIILQEVGGGQRRDARCSPLPRPRSARSR